MAESLKKVTDLLSDVAEAGKNLSEYVQEGIKSVEKIAAEGQKMHTAIAESLPGLQQQFHTTLQQAVQLIEQNRIKITSTIDEITTSVQKAVDEIDPSKSQAQFQSIKDSLSSNFGVDKEQVQKDIEQIITMITEVQDNVKELINAALDAASILKVASTKMMDECKGRLQKDFEKLKSTSEDVKKRTTKELQTSIDNLSKEMAKAIDQVKATKENVKKGAAEAKQALQKSSEDLKSKTAKLLDNCKSDLEKSIGNIQKQAEKSIEDVVKESEKAVANAKKGAM